MEWNPSKWPISFTSSIIANILYYAFLIPSMITYPNYSPFTHSVSALGAVTRNPGWVFFNIGLTSIGITLLPFYYGINKWYEDAPEKKKLIRIVQILGIIDCISIIMITIYPTDIQSAPHDFWSIMNFIFILMTIVVVNITLWNHSGFDKRIAYYGYAVCGICLFYGLSAIINHEIWILEHLSFMTALGYALAIGIKMLKNELEKK